MNLIEKTKETLNIKTDKPKYKIYKCENCELPCIRFEKIEFRKICKCDEIHLKQVYLTNEQVTKW